MNFKNIFDGMKNYCVIRFSEKYPNILGGDIDILCCNLNYLEKYLRNVIPNNYTIKKRFGERGNIHIDVYEKNNFIIKFDLSNSVKLLYPEFKIPENYTKEVIKNSFPNTFNIMVPRIEDELSLRWLEYQKYKSRPEKIKHLLFIQKHNIPYNKFILE